MTTVLTEECTLAGITVSISDYKTLVERAEQFPSINNRLERYPNSPPLSLNCPYARNVTEGDVFCDLQGMRDCHVYEAMISRQVDAEIRELEGNKADLSAY